MPNNGDLQNEVEAFVGHFKRKIEEIGKGHADTESLMKEMQAHNKSLQDILNMQAKSEEEKAEAVKKEREETGLKTLQSRIKDLTEARNEAMEVGDFSKANSISDEIFDLKLEERKAPVEVKPEPKTFSAIPDDQQAMIDQWAEDTGWYKTDPMMASAAAVVERRKKQEVLKN